MKVKDLYERLDFGTKVLISELVFVGGGEFVDAQRRVHYSGCASDVPIWLSDWDVEEISLEAHLTEFGCGKKIERGVDATISVQVTPVRGI